MHKLLSILLFGFVFSLPLKAGESYANNSVLEKGNWVKVAVDQTGVYRIPYATLQDWRSEEHTSELQSRPHLVCRLLLEKKKDRPTCATNPPSTTVSLRVARQARLLYDSLL